MKKLLLFFIILNSLLAENISYYNIDLSLDKGGEIKLIEDIEYNFGSHQKHGILRDIPTTIKYQNRVIDIGLYDFNIKMDNRDIEWEKSELKYSYKGIRFKIGSKDKLITKRHRYNISYKASNILLPYNDKYDTLRWNLVGTKWKIPIDRVKINISLPKELNKNSIKIKLFRGSYGSKQEVNNSIIEWIDNNHFSFFLHSFKPYNGVTIEILIPLGVLQSSGQDTIKEPFIINFWRYFEIPIIILFFIYLIIEAKRVGLRGFLHHSYPIFYSPPKNISTLQASILLYGKNRNKDIFSAILELATKGYITIINRDNKQYIQKNSKSIDNLSYEQKYLLKILFPKNKTIYKFTSISNKIDTLNNKTNKIVYQKAFKKRVEEAKKSFIFKSIGIFTILFIISDYITYLLYGRDTATLSIYWVIITSISIYGLVSSIKSRLWLGVMISLFAIFAFGGIIILILEDLSFQKFMMTPILLSSTTLPFILFLQNYIHPLNSDGKDIYYHLLGLKKFIKRVDRDRLKKLLEQNPNYMEDILPYSILFGLNKHWIRINNEIVKSKYNWYDGELDNLNLISTQIYTQTKPIINYSNDTSYYSSSSSSFSSSDSGGYSGGGGGGGGGDSW